MNATDDTPRVWVGCLACYNGGRLVGAWVDATEAEDMAGDFDAYNGGEVWSNEFDDEQRRAHLAEGHEEFWCFDLENFGAALTGECSPVEAARIAGALESVGGPPKAVAAYVANIGAGYVDWDTLADDFGEAFAGEWDSLEHFADEQLEESGDLADIPERLRPYFNTAAYARDLRLGGDVWTEDSPAGVFVFWNR
jgi:antirestriction protein